MAYTIIPLANQDENGSQPGLRENFSLLKRFLQYDHSVLGSTGYHQKMSFLRQVAIPATAVNEMKLFSRTSAFGSTELSLRRENNGAVNEFTTGMANLNGWTRLPSGLLFIWGIRSGAGAITGNGVITYAVDVPSFPGFASVFNAQVTVYNNTNVDVNTAIKVTNYTALITELRVFGSLRAAVGAAPVEFTWLVMGV